LRKFLEKSDLTFISIKNELEILNLYLAIEKIRYNDKFSFEINYPKEIGEKLIPTMLIQPFVENAVKHGIAHKTTHSQITISIYLIHQLIVIEIKDNGIGRKESDRINQNRKNHKSKGIQLVKSKIEIVKLKYNLKIGLEIEDVETETEKGTKVILKIPMYD
jgi:LytS/YehU family sensor histidine kinase